MRTGAAGSTAAVGSRRTPTRAPGGSSPRSTSARYLGSTLIPCETTSPPSWCGQYVSKAKPGRELQVHGSGGLLRWLLERDLVDELNLLLFPVILGDGLRLFPEGGQTHGLTLVESKATPSGVTIQTYRPAGRATYGNAGE